MSEKIAASMNKKIRNLFLSLITIPLSGLFHMTLGTYDYNQLGESQYPYMSKIVFVLFQVKFETSCTGKVELMDFCNLYV